MRIPKIGDMVFYKDPIKDGAVTSDFWPALIYKVYPKECNYAGIYVFSDTGIHRLAKVYLSNKPETWNWNAEEFKDA